MQIFRWNMHKSEENISMTLRNIMEKLKTALSLVFQVLQGVVSFFIVLWKMELSSIVSRYLRSFKEALTSRKFLGLDSMSWSFGIVFSLLSFCYYFRYFRRSIRTILRKRQEIAQRSIPFLLLILLTQRVIQWILIILRSRTNISAHT